MYSIFDAYLTGRHVSNHAENCGGHLTLMTLLQQASCSPMQHTRPQNASSNADVLAGLKLLRAYLIEAAGVRPDDHGQRHGRPSNTQHMLAEVPGVCVPQGQAEPALRTTYPFAQADYDAALQTTTLTPGSIRRFRGRERTSLATSFATCSSSTTTTSTSCTVLRHHDYPDGADGEAVYFAGYDPVVVAAVGAVRNNNPSSMI